MVHGPPVDMVTKATSVVWRPWFLLAWWLSYFFTILRSDGSVVKLETLPLRIQLSYGHYAICLLGTCDV